MSTLLNGYEEECAVKIFQETVDKYGMEKIKRSIVLSSYGFYITMKANRFYDEINYNFEDQKQMVEYFDESITLEEVADFNKDDDNSQTCYIDFYSARVHLL
jgi:hypothetical protein